MTNEITNTQTDIYRPETFAAVAQISAMMANSPLTPATLRENKQGMLPAEQVQANCFLVAEQAMRWGMSPFAVAQCASVVHGRLMWEGKLVAAVVEKLAGLRLSYAYEGSGDAMRVTVSGKYPDEVDARTVSGTVASWKTDQWKAKDYEQRLAYRGAREWARRHAPAVMLGVSTDDEAEDFDPRPSMRDATPQPAINPFPAALPKVEMKNEPKDEPAKESPNQAQWVAAKILKVEGRTVTLQGSKQPFDVTANGDGVLADLDFLGDAPSEVQLEKWGKKFILVGVRVRDIEEKSEPLPFENPQKGEEQ